MRMPRVTAALSATMIAAVLAMPPLAPATAQTNPQPNAQALVELPLIETGPVGQTVRPR